MMGVRFPARLAAASLLLGLALTVAVPARAADVALLFSQLDQGDAAGARAGLLAPEPEGDAEKSALWLLSAAIALEEGRLDIAVVSMAQIDRQALPEALAPRYGAVSAALDRRLSNPAVYAAVQAAVQPLFAADFDRALQLGQVGERLRGVSQQFIEGHFGAADIGRYQPAGLFVPQRANDVRTSGFSSAGYRLWSDHDATWEIGGAVQNQFYRKENDLNFLGLTVNSRYSKMLTRNRVLHLRPFVARDFAGAGLYGLAWRGGATATLSSRLSPGRTFAVTLGTEVLAYDKADDFDGMRTGLDAAYTVYGLMPDTRLALKGGVSYQSAANGAYDRTSVAAGPAVTWFDVAGLADITADITLGGAWHANKDVIQTTEVRRDFTLSAGLEAEFPIPATDAAMVLRGRYYGQSSTIGRHDYDSGTVGLGVRWRY